MRERDNLLYYPENFSEPKEVPPHNPLFVSIYNDPEYGPRHFIGSEAVRRYIRFSGNPNKNEILAKTIEEIKAWCPEEYMVHSSGPKNDILGIDLMALQEVASLVKQLPMSHRDFRYTARSREIFGLFCKAVLTPQENQA